MKKNKHSLFSVRIIYLFTTAFLVVLSLVTFLQIRSLVESAQLVDHTNKVNQSLQKISLILVEAETNKRAFLLTSDSLMLRKRDASLKDMGREIKVLESLTQQDPEQVQHIKKLILAISAKLLSVENLSGFDRNGSANPAMKKNIMEGVSAMNEVKQSILQMTRAQNELHTTHIMNFAQYSMITPLYIVVLFLGAIVILMLSYYRINKALRNTEQMQHQFQSLVMEAPAAICVLREPEHVFEMSNDVFLKMAGRADVVGKTVRQVFPELEAQSVFELLSQVYKTGETFKAEDMPVNITRENGLTETRYFDMEFRASYNANEKITGVIVNALETTEEMASKAKIAESELRFRSLAEALPQLIWMADGNGISEYVSSRWKEYTGVQPGGEQEWNAIVHPDDLAGVNKAWMNSLNTGSLYNYDVRLKSHTGEFNWFKMMGEPVINKENKIIKWVGAASNIHAEKSFAQQLTEQVDHRTRELYIANTELQEKNQLIALSKYNQRFLSEFSEKFSSYQAHAEFFLSVVLYVADLTQLDYVLIGRLEQDDSGDSFVQTIAMAAFGKLVENINYPLPHGPCEQVVHGKIYSYPHQCKSKFPKNQTLVQYNVEGYVGYPLTDMAGKEIGLIALMHQKDIEDCETVTSILKIVAKRTEIELERINNEKQLELTNQELKEKNKTLEKMNRELELFAHISSHDLQEPLRNIKMFASRVAEMESDKLSAKGKEYFERIQSSITRMRILIEDLLAYSRTTNNEGQFEIKDLGQIVEEVKAGLQETLDEKQATIEASQMCEVRIVPFQFRQLLHNLLSNSLKFSAPGVPPHIEIKSHIIKTGPSNDIEGLLSGKEYCHITVADNGIGFEPQYNRRIFDAFQRLHGKEKYSGTGIGLSIVKKIIENHNGIVTATGKLNSGAAIDIYIPTQ